MSLKKYIEMRLHRKDTAKRLSFLKYQKPIIRDTKVNIDFFF